MDCNWSWISYDNVIKKKVLCPGNSLKHPFDGFRCDVKFLDVSCRSGQTDIFPQKETQTQIVIGEAENLFERIMERLLQTMVIQEVSQCELKLKNALCSIKIKLVDIQPPSTPLHLLSNETKLSEAERLKQRASELIKESRYEDAVPLLKRSFRCICWAGGNREDNGFSDLYFSVIANLSLCALKLNDYERTVSLCHRLLKHRPNHVKCLLRRALAYDYLQETEKAKKDVQLALTIEPHNKTAEQILQHIKSHITKQKMEYSALVKKMLQVDKL